MNIIVTGDTGFIGAPLCATLLKQGHSVLGISRKWARTKHEHVGLHLGYAELWSIKFLIDTFKPDAIIHLAGHAMVKDYDHTVSLNNIIPLHKILEVIPKACQLIFASSTTVYGQHDFPRKTIHPTYPDSIYAETKLYCEKLIQKYHTVYDKLDNYKILRLCAHIAPNSTHGLVHDIYNKLCTDNPYLELYGPGPGSRKPFLWIEDSVKAIIESIDCPTGTYNISPNDNLTVQEVATTIMDGLNKHKVIKWIDGGWLGDTSFVHIQSSFPWIRSSKEAVLAFVESKNENLA